MVVFRVGRGFIFFFQAGDGIRDLLRSRGIGDVFKRQCRYCFTYVYASLWIEVLILGEIYERCGARAGIERVSG